MTPVGIGLCDILFQLGKVPRSSCSRAR